MYDFFVDLFDLFGFTVPSDSLAFTVLVIWGLTLALEFFSVFIYCFCRFVGNLRKVQSGTRFIRVRTKRKED